MRNSYTYYLFKSSIKHSTISHVVHPKSSQTLQQTREERRIFACSPNPYTDQKEHNPFSSVLKSCSKCVTVHEKVRVFDLSNFFKNVCSDLPPHWMASFLRKRANTSAYIWRGRSTIPDLWSPPPSFLTVRELLIVYKSFVPWTLKVG